MSEYPWLKSYPSHVAWEQDIPQKPLPDMIDDAAEAAPDRQAIDFLGRTYDYRELAGCVNRAAKGFQEIGVGKGVKVGLFLPNCPQFMICYYGVLKAGGTVVNYNPLYSVRELRHQVEDSETDIMVTLSLKALYPKVAELLETSRLKKVVVNDFQTALPTVKRWLFPILKRKDISPIPEDERHVKYAGLLDNDGRYTPVAIDPVSDLAVLQYTGGTTGVPKGAMLTHGNIYANVLQCSRYFEAALGDEQSVMLGVLPFFHVFAMTAVMHFSVHKQMKLIIHPRFELVSVLKDIHRKKPTILPGVPTMYNAIINHQNLSKYDLSSIRFCVSGGAALPMEVKQKFERLTGCTLVEGYGLTEASPVTHANPFGALNKAGSVGLPLPGTVVEIIDLETGGLITEAGENGEICIRGPQVMKGYYNKPEESENVLELCSPPGGEPKRQAPSQKGRSRLGRGYTENGAPPTETAGTVSTPPQGGSDCDAIRLHTGDIGYLDEEGYTFISDRLKEMIIASGYNIYPRQVEEAIYLHEEVVECAVVGVPHEYRGESVKAFVVKKEGAALDEEGLRAFLRDRLAKHMIPTEVEFRDELPKSMIGKILKKELVSK